jgi:hypothetical protein
VSTQVARPSGQVSLSSQAGGDNLLLVGQRLVCVFRAEKVQIGLVQCACRIGQSEILGHGASNTHKAAAAILEKDIDRNMLEKGFQQILRHPESPVRPRFEEDQPHDNQTQQADPGAPQRGDAESIEPVSESA